MEPDVAQQVKAMAMARIGIGAAAVVAPGMALRRWLGPGSNRPDSKLLARSAGIRDVAIGVGTLLAAKHDAPVRGWVEAGALCDAGDLVAVLLGFKGLPRTAAVGTAAAAIGGIVFGRRLVSRLSA